MHFVSEINTGPFTWLTVVGFAVVGLTVVGFAVVGFGLDDLKGIDAASFLAGIASLEKGNSPVALNPAIKWLGFRALSHNVAIKPAINKYAHNIFVVVLTWKIFLCYFLC